MVRALRYFAIVFDCAVLVGIMLMMPKELRESWWMGYVVLAVFLLPLMILNILVGRLFGIENVFWFKEDREAYDRMYKNKD